MSVEGLTDRKEKILKKIAEKEKLRFYEAAVLSERRGRWLAIMMATGPESAWAIKHR